jgi:dTDP-4-dehydrorhamnose 3,5-epimerase
MRFIQTKLKGAYILEHEKMEDERGFFTRTWHHQKFSERGLDANLMQCSISFNKRKETLRGMHFQLSPFAETMLMRCTQGAIYDVITDLCQDSETFLQWRGRDFRARSQLRKL